MKSNVIHELFVKVGRSGRIKILQLKEYGYQSFRHSIVYDEPAEKG